MNTISDEELLTYADELLETKLASHIESILRTDQATRDRLKNLLQRRDQGNLSVGDLWRHERLSCPKRSELGLYLINALENEYQDYVQFHLKEVGCSYCLATLAEMESVSATSEADQKSKKRTEQLFASSAGLLRKRP